MIQDQYRRLQKLEFNKAKNFNTLTKQMENKVNGLEKRSKILKRWTFSFSDDDETVELDLHEWVREKKSLNKTVRRKINNQGGWSLGEVPVNEGNSRARIRWVEYEMAKEMERWDCVYIREGGWA